MTEIPTHTRGHIAFTNEHMMIATIYNRPSFMGAWPVHGNITLGYREGLP